MKRYLLWALILYGLVSWVGGDAFTWTRNHISGWSDSTMGGGCEAFMEGGELEQEYLAICTDEVLRMENSKGDIKYSPARFILFDATGDRLQAYVHDIFQGRSGFNFDGKEHVPPSDLPSARQLRVALMAQWGGACEFMLSEHKPLPALQDVAPVTEMKACLDELEALHPRAWRALVERHWRLRESQAPEYHPTKEQVRRALDVETLWFGIDKTSWRKAGVGFGAVAAAVYLREPLLESLTGLGILLSGLTRRATRRRQPRERADHEGDDDHQDQSHASREPASWRVADPAFKTWFVRHFDPADGLYGTGVLRQRIYKEFMRTVDEKRLVTFDKLAKHLKATFHPDTTAGGRFTRAQLTDISQYVNQNLPAWKAA